MTSKIHIDADRLAANRRGRQRRTTGRWAHTLGAACLSVFAFTLAQGAAAAAEQFPCSGAMFSPYSDPPPAGYEHGRYAPAGRGFPKTFSAYYSLFDDDDDDDGDGLPDLRANPEFVAYELRAVYPDVNGVFHEPDISIRRPSKWYSAREHAFLWTGRPGITSTRLDDSYNYGGQGPGWDRGHLAMSDHAQRISGQAACGTHEFWNASPQAANFNQGPWRHLEAYSAAASNKFGTVWIITGPIFDPTTPKLSIGQAGEPPVEVPDAFFKVIVRETPVGLEALGFIFDHPNELRSGVASPAGSWVNCNRAKRLNHVYDHRPQLSALIDIERRTGLRFFDGRPDRETLVQAVPREVWPVEERYWDPGAACGGQRSHP